MALCYVIHNNNTWNTTKLIEMSSSGRFLWLLIKYAHYSYRGHCGSSSGWLFGIALDLQYPIFEAAGTQWQTITIMQEHFMILRYMQTYTITSSHTSTGTIQIAKVALLLSLPDTTYLNSFTINSQSFHGKVDTNCWAMPFNVRPRFETLHNTSFTNTSIPNQDDFKKKIKTIILITCMIRHS